MLLNQTRRWPQSWVRTPFAKVQIILTHPAESTAHLVVVEHQELDGWIQHARRHGFAFEAKSIEAPQQPEAA
jgi:hypothetical protein